MKLVLLFFVFGFPFHTCLTLGGKYKATVENLNNQPELSRKYADWHLRFNRIGRDKTILAGSFTLKTTIHKPKLVFDTFMMTSNGQYRKAAVDTLVNQMTLCDISVREKFFYPLFEGNMTWTDDCIMTPGTMKFREKEELDLNAVAHRVMDQCLYGRYKAILTIVDQKKRVIGGATYYVKIDKV